MHCISLQMEMMMMPTGFRFNPTDEELIELLDRKVCGQDMHFHSRFILQTEVYHLDPQHLQWDPNVVLANNERFYYCLRENDSREVSGQGWWRATGHVKKISTKYNNKLLVGFKRPLTFHRFRDRQDIERRRKNAIKTNWIMHEYSVESYSTEWRLCKIKYKEKPTVQLELENIRSDSSHILAEQQLTDFAAKQQQPPQSLPPFSDIRFSYFCGGENQQNQLYSSEADNMYGNEPSNLAEWNLQMGAIGVEHQQEIAFCDTYYDYFDDDHLPQIAYSSDQLFPIWPWHADPDRIN